MEQTGARLLVIDPITAYLDPGMNVGNDLIVRRALLPLLLLAYELPDGRLKLIDGHLRRDLDPDMEVEVEVLDVSDDEARALLLSIDPLAALAQTQQQLHDRLRELTPTPSPELQAAWQAAAEASLAALDDPLRRPMDAGPAQFYVLLTCKDEHHQRDLLARFQSEGLECRALLS